jgi:uncharacterized protein
MRRRFVVWQREDAPGMEAVEVELHPDRLGARGVQLGHGYRMDWALQTSAGWVTERLTVEVVGPHAGRLALTRADLPDGAQDCDLGYCPLTNTMPMLRHHLHEGGEPVDFVIAPRDDPSTRHARTARDSLRDESSGAGSPRPLSLGARSAR